LTIGYGHTKDVRPGDVVTLTEAEKLLIEDLEWSESVVNNQVKVPLNQNQFDALVSFVFNVGSGNFGKSTLLKRLNAGRYDDVPHELKRWNKGGGEVLPGLTRRREAETKLFCEPIQKANQTKE
jgi:lysozyme